MMKYAKIVFLGCRTVTSKSEADYTFKKQTLRITQLEKVRFIKVNELILIQVELF